MSFPTLQVRPNEKNPKILRAHEFLRQSNQLVERNLINNEGKKMLAKMLTKMVAEAKAIYALDEKRTDSRKSVKLLEQLKSAHQTSISVMEDRFVNADLARQVVEKKLDVQKKFSEIEYLRKSVQEKKLEVQREIEKNDKKVASMAKANEEMAVRSAAILKHLENSADVSRLRKMEEEKRAMEATVGALRDQKKALADEILTKRATLKAEAKKPFKKMVIDCAKHYKLCQSLTPKLAISQRNVELLKEEEEARRASGSLDETIPFDRSFVLASMEKDTPLASRTPPPPSPAPTLPSATPTPQKPAEPSQSVEKAINSAPKAPSSIQELPAQAPPTSENVEMVEEPVKTSTPVETQRIERQVTPEVEEMEGEEEEMEKDRSVDCMEEEENPDEEPMEQDEPVQVFAKITTPDPSSKSPASASQSASGTSSSTNLASEAQKAHKEQEALLRDVAARLEEADEVMSDNGSHRDDNFSFNFFGSAEKNGADGDENGNESEANFDFNFNANGSGDGAQSGGSGGFDFLGGSDENPTSGVADSDPFGFGKSSGGGDMSFNFNFDGGNGENEGGAGAGAAGNSSFFNF